MSTSPPTTPITPEPALAGESSRDAAASRAARASSLPPESADLPTSAGALALARSIGEGAVSHFRGPRAELATLRARIALASAIGDARSERAALVATARALGARGSELDAAIKYARRALLLEDDRALREELAGWFTALGEPHSAVLTLRPLIVDAEASERARILTRMGVLLARSGDAAAAVDALAEAAEDHPEEPGALELIASLAAWAPDVVSAERAAEAYLSAARQRETRGDKPAAFENLLRAFESAPASEAVAERLSSALSARGRSAAADEVSRAHARASPGGARHVHVVRMRQAVREADYARALVAGLDAGLESELDMAATLTALERAERRRTSPPGDVPGAEIGIDELCERAGLHELIAARLEIACDTLGGDLLGRVRLELGRIYAGPLASAERAVEAWIKAVAGNPAAEEAKAALRGHAASTRDPMPIVEALIRAGLAEETQALAERVACLRELVVVAEQRLADPGLALWAVRTIQRIAAEDDELAQIARRLMPRARLQDEALNDARGALGMLRGRERTEPLRRAAAILRGRPDHADEFVSVLEELCELVPEDRSNALMLERVLERHERLADLARLWRALQARAASGGETARARLALAGVLRRRGDSASALEELAPLLDDSGAHGAAFATAAILAARLGAESVRARAWLRIATPLLPPLRALLTSFAAESLLACGHYSAARQAAEKACAADPSLARPIAVRAEVALASDPRSRGADSADLRALDRAVTVLVPRIALCRALADAYDRLGDTTLALAWTQRELALCPLALDSTRSLLAGVCATGDASRIANALAWVLEQPQPVRELGEPMMQALRALSALDRSRAGALARRTLDVIGARLDPVRETLLWVADVLDDRALHIAVHERWLASGAAGADRANLCLELAERRKAEGDADGALRALCRAVVEGAEPERILADLEQAPPAKSSDGELSRLEARAEALALVAGAPSEDVVLALRELGAARYDLAGDVEGALAAWQRALALSPARGVDGYAADLAAFLPAEQAVSVLGELAAQRPEPADAAAVLAVAARTALRAGLRARALELAVQALELDSTRADALAVAERAASADDGPAIERVYELLARAALGMFGVRAVHYRAARQLEKRGFADAALRHAIRAFEAVPAEGVAYVLMGRLAERTGRFADVVQALENVAVRTPDAQSRAAWLRRAALLAGQTEDGRRLRVDVLLRALSVRADVDTMRALGDAVTSLVEALPQDKELTEARFARALELFLPNLEGPDGARVAIESARTALLAFDSAELALSALERALAADGSIDEYAALEAHVRRLANAPEAARAWLERSLRVLDDPLSSPGRPALELMAALAAEFDDRASRARLLVRAAEREPDDKALVARAEAAARSSGESELVRLALAAVPAEERVTRLMALATDAAQKGDWPSAIEAALHAFDVPGTSYARRAEILDAVCELHRQSGRGDELEALLQGRLERSDLALEERVGIARRLAAALVDAEAPERALEVLERLPDEARAEPALLADAIGFARRAGDRSREAEYLAALIASTEEPQRRAPLLAELAGVLEETGDAAGALARWSELLELEPQNLQALAAIERAAEARGDYGTLAAMLLRRASLTTSHDDARRIHLRRAMVLEQRLGRPDDARRELESLLASSGDNLSVLRVLADLNERHGAPLAAAPLWLRASAVARDRSEAADLARRACKAHLQGGDLSGARRVLEGLRTWASSRELAELRVDVERRFGHSSELADALDELARTSDVTALERAHLFCEAAQCSLALNDQTGALERARRAARLGPALSDAVLLSSLLEYVERGGPGTVQEAADTVGALDAMDTPHDPADLELCAFLRAEALDVSVGVGAGMRELNQAYAALGPKPLIALGIAERLTAGGEPARALALFDIALASDLRGVRSPALVALAATRAARDAAELERGLAYLEIAAQDPDQRAAALELQADLREQIRPETDPGVSASDVPRPRSSTPAERDADPEVDARRYSSIPPPPRSSSKPPASAGGLLRPAPSALQDAGPEVVISDSGKVSLLAFPPVNASEAALLTALAKGSVEAGRELIQQLENRSGRTQDWVAACRRVAVLLPGDRWILEKLQLAALADRNYVYARAVEHVLAAFSSELTKVEPPPLHEQAEQPEWVRAMLFRDTQHVASEALSLVWEGAQHVFRRDQGSYGLTGLTRVRFGSTEPVANVYSAAVRTLGLTRTPLFQRPGAGPVTVSVALLSPPALIVSGEPRESAELRFHVGAMLAATLPQFALLFASPEAQVRAVLRALALAFGSASQERGSLASVANLAEVLWESIPSRSQRRLRELCDDANSLVYEAALANAKAATRRAGLFVAGDILVAVRETCADENIPFKVLEEPGGLAALCSASRAVADLVRLATSPEYAETRWQSARGGARHPSGSFATLSG